MQQSICDQKGRRLQIVPRSHSARMLKLTKKADYGLIAMRHLAEHAAVGTCSAKDLAELYSIPQEALAKILQRLKKARLLKSLQGTTAVMCWRVTRGRSPLWSDSRDRRTALHHLLQHHPGRVRPERALHGSRTAAQGEPHDRGCPGKVDGLGFDRKGRAAGFGERIGYAALSEFWRQIDFGRCGAG